MTKRAEKCKITKMKDFLKFEKKVLVGKNSWWVKSFVFIPHYSQPKLFFTTLLWWSASIPQRRSVARYVSSAALWLKVFCSALHAQRYTDHLYLSCSYRALFYDRTHDCIRSTMLVRLVFTHSKSTLIRLPYLSLITSLVCFRWLEFNCQFNSMQCLLVK